MNARLRRRNNTRLTCRERVVQGQRKAQEGSDGEFNAMDFKSSPANPAPIQFNSIQFNLGSVN